MARPRILCAIDPIDGCVTSTPTANSVVKSNSTGKLDRGWMPAALETAIATNTSNISSLETAIASNTSSITALASKIVNSTISTTWTGDSAPYTQTLSISGVKSNSIVSVTLSTSATKEQVEAYQELNWTDGGQSTGGITLKAWGTKNTISIPVIVTVEV